MLKRDYEREIENALRALWAGAIAAAAQALAAPRLKSVKGRKR
jgi:hypothetical protein